MKSEESIISQESTHESLNHYSRPQTTIASESALYDGEAPTEETARKIAHIEKLARDEEREGLSGSGPCSCRASWEDAGRQQTTDELRARAVALVRFPDSHSRGEHSRRVHMAILRADPTYEPPEEWCAGWLLEEVKKVRANAHIHLSTDDQCA